MNQGMATCAVCGDFYYTDREHLCKGRPAVESFNLAAKPETVDHPQHYGGADNPYEVIKVLEAWLTPEEFRGFLKGNAIKYNARALLKGATLEDHKKAAWYQKYLVDWENRLAVAAINKVRG